MLKKRWKGGVEHRLGYNIWYDGCFFAMIGCGRGVMMKLGYACINMSMPSKFRTCRLRTVEEQGLEKVKEIAVHNLAEVIRVLEWNIAHEIYFFPDVE